MKQAIVSPGAITKIDNDLHALAKSIGRVVDGNKSTTGASSGQFVVLLNSTISGRTDGLYTASKAIPANTAIDSSYLTVSNDGGLNALNGKIQNMFENRNYSKEGITFTDCTYVDGGYVDFGDFVLFNIRVTITVASSTTKQYMTLPNSIKSRSSITALTAMNVTTDDAPIYAISTSGAAIHLKDTLANKAYSIFGMWLKG